MTRYTKSRKLKNQRIALFILGITIFILLFGYLYTINHQTSTQENVTSDLSEIRKESKKDLTLEYFLRDTLSEYTTLKSQVKAEDITRVFPISLKKIEGGKQGWIVEVKKQQSAMQNYYNYSYYLLTPLLEMELKNVMSTVSEDMNATCILDKVQTVGNEEGLTRDLQESSGYVILSGNKCIGYGAANSGFTSVYSIRTGEKIKLKGDFQIPGTVWRGVSPSGNSLGKLRGIYGIVEPILVVEYGQFESTSNLVEQVVLVAYFDLQSGQLNQLVRFK